MSPSEARSPGARIDLRGWIAVAWAVVFGILYAKMMLEARAPGWVAAAARILSGGVSLLGG